MTGQERDVTLSMPALQPPPPKPSDLLAPPDFIAHWSPETTDEQYHSDRTSVGSTQVRKVNDSPIAFFSDYFDPDPDADEEDEKEPEHFRIGKLVHMAILEGTKFKELYVVPPDFGDMRTKAAREKKAEWLVDMAPGTVLCTRKDLDLILGVARNLMKHPQGPDLISDGQAEVAGYYRDPETGIKCRIKPDHIKFSGIAMTDLKTARTGQRIFFGSAAFDKRYDIQLFMYGEGARIINGHTPEIISNLVFEKKKPYEVSIFYWAKEDLVQAEVDYRAGLRKLRKCIDENKWPFRQEMIERIYTPQWFIHKHTVGA